MAAPILQAEGALNVVITGNNAPTIPTHQADDILVAGLDRPLLLGGGRRLGVDCGDWPPPGITCAECGVDG